MEYYVYLTPRQQHVDMKILVNKQLSHLWFGTHNTHLTSRQAKDHHRGRQDTAAETIKVWDILLGKERLETDSKYCHWLDNFGKLLLIFKGSDISLFFNYIHYGYEYSHERRYFHKYKHNHPQKNKIFGSFSYYCKYSPLRV